MSDSDVAYAETFDPNAIITLTDNAAKKAAQFIAKEQKPSIAFRVYITGGGCSGFQYGFTFDEQKNEDDTLISTKGVAIVIDPMSLQYLTGSEIDYVEELLGSRFVVNNPHAKTTCGCGASFSI